MKKPNQHGVFVFNAAGNNPQYVNQCWAYNALCVGGYLDNATYGAYADDSLALFSYLNRNEREGPQLLGPMGAMKLPYYTSFTSTPEYTPGSGTSYATPFVAATAGLLLSSNSAILARRPALMRARAA